MYAYIPCERAYMHTHMPVTYIPCVHAYICTYDSIHTCHAYMAYMVYIRTIHTIHKPYIHWPWWWWWWWGTWARPIHREWFHKRSVGFELLRWDRPLVDSPLVIPTRTFDLALRFHLELYARLTFQSQLNLWFVKGKKQRKRLLYTFFSVVSISQSITTCLTTFNGSNFNF